jgi:hypothetical protein
MPPVMQSQRSSRPTVSLVPVDDATLTRDLGFLCELVGMRGEALKAKKSEIAGFKKRYGLDAITFGQILAVYRDPHNGPCKARHRLKAAVEMRTNGNGEQELDS